WRTSKPTKGNYDSGRMNWNRTWSRRRRRIGMRLPTKRATFSISLPRRWRRKTRADGSSLLRYSPTSNGFQAKARACSVSVETDHALDSLFGRIFYGKPVSTFPENALAVVQTDTRSPPTKGRTRWQRVNCEAI